MSVTNSVYDCLKTTIHEYFIQKKNDMKIDITIQSLNEKQDFMRKNFLVINW